MMTSLAVKTVTVVFVACFAVLQMTLFEVLLPPQQPINSYHASDDSVEPNARQERNIYLQCIHLQQSDRIQNKHWVKQNVINPIHKFIQFIANKTDCIQSVYEHSQSRAFKNLKRIELSLKLEPIIAILFLSLNSEELPHH